MTKRRYPKALAALALGACLWALPAGAAAPDTAVMPAPADVTATAAPETQTAQPEPEQAAEQTAAPAAGTAQPAVPGQSSPLGGLATTSGGAALVGVGAYSYVRKQRQDERDRRRTEQQAHIYFENHTRNGTLRPGEQDGFE